MGISSSTARTESVEGDSPVGIINISTDVAQRLMTGMPTDSVKPSSNSNLLQPSSAGYYGEPAISTMQVRQEKDQELRANDVYWTNRLQALEVTFKNGNQILEREYNNAIDAVKKRFEGTNGALRLPPCPYRKAQVVECYEKNLHETLNCLAEVKRFTDCVNMTQIRMLQGKATELGKRFVGK